jgi:hypothetical protein
MNSQQGSNLVYKQQGCVVHLLDQQLSLRQCQPTLQGRLQQVHTALTGSTNKEAHAPLMLQLLTLAGKTHP